MAYEYMIIESRQIVYKLGPFSSRRCAKVWAKRYCVRVSDGTRIPYEIVARAKVTPLLDYVERKRRQEHNRFMRKIK